MEKNQYKNIVAKYTPKENRLFNGMLAFISGGLMGMLGQLIVSLYTYYLDIPTKQAGTYMIITLIFLGCLFTCFGFFDKWVSFLKAGLFIPITGFAHSMTSAALEYKNEGPVLGIGANIFKLAGTVILYGIVSVYVFGLFRLLVLGG